jgi:hypothetical protein
MTSSGKCSKSVRAGVATIKGAHNFHSKQQVNFIHLSPHQYIPPSSVDADGLLPPLGRLILGQVGGGKADGLNPLEISPGTKKMIGDDACANLSGFQCKDAKGSCKEYC